MRQSQRAESGLISCCLFPQRPQGFEAASRFFRLLPRLTGSGGRICRGRWNGWLARFGVLQFAQEQFGGFNFPMQRFADVLCIIDLADNFLLRGSRSVPFAGLVGGWPVDNNNRRSRAKRR